MTIHSLPSAAQLFLFPSERGLLGGLLPHTTPLQPGQQGVCLYQPRASQPRLSTHATPPQSSAQPGLAWPGLAWLAHTTSHPSRTTTSHHAPRPSSQLHLLAPTEGNLIISPSHSCSLPGWLAHSYSLSVYQNTPTYSTIMQSHTDRTRSDFGQANHSRLLDG